MKESEKGKKKIPARVKIKALRGMSDILPDEIKFWRHLENIAHELFPFYGYREIRLPLLEETKLFVRSIGDDTEIVQKEMYTIKEKDGGSVSLRPEATASVVRALLEHNLHLGGDVKKYYYIGPMFRKERPQAGRMRQFHQLGVELIGSGDLAVMDAEVIDLACEFLIRSGIKNFELQLNHLGCQSCREKFISALKDYFKLYLKALCPDCQRKFETNPLRILDCKKEGCQSLKKNAPKISDFICHKCQSHFDKLQEILRWAGISFSLNHHLVRGLDYYTGVVFEIVHPELGAQNALVAGGRYDSLIEELGGASLPATGFSFGLERMIMCLKNTKVPIEDLPKTEIMLITLGTSNLKDTIGISRNLRKESHNVQLCCDENKSLKSQLRLANKIGVRFVLILGDEEREKRSIQVKNMETGKQELIKIENLVGFLRKII